CADVLIAEIDHHQPDDRATQQRQLRQSTTLHHMFTTPFLKATPFLTGESPHEFLIDETRLPSRHGFQGSSASPRSVVREVTSAMESIPGVTIVTSDSDDPNPHEKEAVDTAAD
ncbi:hypothetical protein FOZ62_005860, partial [Perkinsus olseni]